MERAFYMHISPYKNLKSIQSKGLVPNFNGGNYDNMRWESLNGVYASQNADQLTSYLNNHEIKSYLIVIIEVDLQTALPDEDTIDIIFDHVLERIARAEGVDPGEFLEDENIYPGEPGHDALVARLTAGFSKLAGESEPNDELVMEAAGLWLEMKLGVDGEADFVWGNVKEQLVQHFRTMQHPSLGRHSIRIPSLVGFDGPTRIVGIVAVKKDDAPKIIYNQIPNESKATVNEMIERLIYPMMRQFISLVEKTLSTRNWEVYKTDRDDYTSYHFSIPSDDQRVMVDVSCEYDYPTGNLEIKDIITEIRDEDDPPEYLINTGNTLYGDTYAKRLPIGPGETRDILRKIITRVQADGHKITSLTGNRITGARQNSFRDKRDTRVSMREGERICKTPGSIFDIWFKKKAVGVEVKLPKEVPMPDMTDEEAEKFEDMMHDSMEEIVAQMVDELDDDADEHWAEARKNDPVKESFLHSFKSLYMPGGKTCEIFKNPSRQEFKQLDPNGNGIRAFIVNQKDVIMWETTSMVHQLVREELKLGPDVIPVVIYGQFRAGADIMITDNTTHTPLWHNPDIWMSVVRNDYLSKTFRTIEVDYYDSNIVGDWRNLDDEEKEEDEGGWSYTDDED